MIEAHSQHVDQTYEDMRTLVNMANEIVDRTPQEQEAIDRITDALAQNPMFDQQRSLERSLDRSIDQSLGRDGRGQ